MKLKELKTEAYRRCGVTTTKQLKKQFPHLTKNRDLRRKTSWQAIVDYLADDLTLADIERTDREVKQGLHRIGRATGQSYQEVEDTWQMLNDTPIEKSFAIVEREYALSVEDAE
ncbi:MAG: hypothetical protein WA902_24015 [Thermosynechococcaceae cyanobacterium]